jgi:hypothetical protein
MLAAYLGKKENLLSAKSVALEHHRDINQELLERTVLWSHLLLKTFSEGLGRCLLSASPTAKLCSTVLSTGKAKSPLLKPYREAEETRLTTFNVKSQHVRG